MIRVLLAMVILSPLLPAASEPGCVLIDGDRVWASQLAARFAAFRSLAPDTEIVPGPLPGVKRWMGGEELRRIATRLGAAIDDSRGVFPDICIEVAVKPLSEDKVLKALRAALPADAESQLELIEFSRTPVPDGDLEFPRSGLSLPPGQVLAGAAVWRGRLRYGKSAAGYARSLPVWARVRLSYRQAIVIAAHEIPAGKVVGASDLRLEEKDVFSFGDHPLTNSREAEGRKARRTIRAGEPVAPALLVEQKMIERGQTVAVSVASGAAQLSISAKAEAGGALGDRVLLRNLSTGNRFHGVVTGRGAARVDVPPPGATKDLENANNTSALAGAVGGGSLPR